MRLIRRIIAIFKLLRKARKQILPNFDELTHEIGLLKNSVDEMGKRIASLQQEGAEMQNNIKIIESRYNGFEKALILQNQLIQILLILQLKNSVDKK